MIRLIVGQAEQLAKLQADYEALKLKFEILLRLVDDLKPAENGRFLLLDHNGHKGLSGK